ncbi:MAG: hypothetical protein IPH20_01530 [Bacteroidales bacterium]|nr:hypothetical protein [Bacteroidales bacterium]
MKKITSTTLAIAILVIASAFNLAFNLESKLLLDGKIELKIPEDFELMKEDMLKVKYPMESRPTLVYTNESGGINVALNHTQNKADQDMITAYKDNLVQTFKSVYPSTKWKELGVKEINGRKVGYMELVTPAMDTEIYNLLFLPILKAGCLFAHLIVQKDMKDWTPVGKEIMNSLIVK